MQDETPAKGQGWALAAAMVIQIPLCIVFILAAAFVSWLFALPKNPPGVVVLLTGQAVLAGVAMWTAFHFIYARRYAPRRIRFYLPILVGWSLALNGATIGAGIWGAHHTQAVMQARQAEALKTALDEAAKAEDVLSDPGGGSVDMHTNAPGEAGRIARAARDLMHDVFAAHSDYTDTLDRLGFADCMLPDRLGADNGPVNSEAVLLAARDAGKTHVDKVDGALSNFRAVLASAKIDAKLKQDALARFDTRAAAVRSVIARRSALQNALIDEFEGMIHVLMADPGGWHVVHNRLGFTDEALLDAYQEHMEKAADIQRRMAALPD
jgi:hypothetical protein